MAIPPRNRRVGQAGYAGPPLASGGPAHPAWPTYAPNSVHIYTYPVKRSLAIHWQKDLSNFGAGDKDALLRRSRERERPDEGAQHPVARAPGSTHYFQSISVGSEGMSGLPD